MAEYKIDLHVHTKETSPCGGVSAKDAVNMYNQIGYQAIMITDHFFHGFFKGLGNLSWGEKIDHYLKGYHEAVKAAEHLDFQVFLGMEFRNTETDDDFLVFGFEETFLYENENLYEKPLPEAFSLFHQAGAMVIQAHPARVRLIAPEGDHIKYNFKQKEMLEFMNDHPDLPELPFSEGNKFCKKSNKETIDTPILLRVCHLRYPELLDGIECFNANYHWAQNPKEIQKIMEDYPHLIGISASDFHETAHLAKGGISLDSSINNTKELISILKEKHFRMISVEYQPLLDKRN